MSLPPAAIAAHPVLFSGRGQEGIIIHNTLFFSIPFRFNFGFNKRQGRKRKKGKKRGKKKEKKSESTVSSACREEAVGTRDGEREKGRGRGE